MAFDLPLHAEAHGRDPGPDTDTFVMIHGFGASSFSWRTWMPALTRRGHVVLIDMKGFGAAPKPDDDRYGPMDQAELIHRLILQRDLRNITLVGHSLGGGVAVLCALRLLDEGSGRLKRLVVVAGSVYAQRLPLFVALARRRRLSTGVMRLLGARLVVRHMLRTMVHDKSAITEGQIEGYAEPLHTPEARRALVQAALQILPPDLPAIATRYPEINVPALLLWGSSDHVVPVRVGRRLAEALPDARLVVLDACGHLPAEELPTESLAALEDFLDERPPTTPT